MFIIFEKKLIAVLILASLCIGASQTAVAEQFIVRNGRPRAEMIIAEKAPRMVNLAAQELQLYLKKISGAELPITTKPTGDYPVTIYVGKSEHTDRLGVTDAGLKYGAFRMVSGPSHLILLGGDFDFVPTQPWPQSNSDRPRAQQEWDQLTGSTWVNPLNSAYRQYNRTTGTWAHDEGGSLNAVCAFLRMLGVRWYMPGELGEVVPERKSLPLLSIDKTVRPDFPLRHWFGAYFVYTSDDVMWERRLGLNSGYAVLGAGMAVHGMRNVHGRKEMQEAHPDYYALIGGKRDTEYRGTGHACFSSEGLIQETINYARAVFDHFDEPAVSVWPQDGLRPCQCELCQGKSPSDQVWGFVDRVARELYKTHPDRLVTCGAYASYKTPPETIENFTPNVAVFISNVQRPGLVDPERWKSYWELIQAWQKKVAPGHIIRNENNRYSLWHDRRGKKPVPFPVMHPRMFVKDLRALKGISLGDWNEVSRSNLGIPGRTFWRAPAIDHLNLYVNSRYLWDAEQDLDELLEEYYALFYGPARKEMKAAIEFAEAKYNRTDRSRRGRGNPLLVELSDRIRLVELLHTARRTAGDTVYGKRIQLMIDELAPLDDLRQEIKEQAKAGDPRENAPVAVAYDVNRKEGLKTCRLKDLVTGKKADIETTFRVGWDRGALVFDIRCQEPDMENLFVTRDVWGGDSVAILLETPYHAYYQIEINPDGRIFDADRGHGVETRWKSLAEVKTHRGEDYWRVEVRIPVAGEKAGAMDPYNFVVGGKPSAEAPWYFNVCRARVRGGEKTAWAFSPTGATYHVPEKFGKLVIR